MCYSIFTLCLVALIAGYFIYGKLAERIFAPDNRLPPAVTDPDGVEQVVAGGESGKEARVCDHDGG